MYGENIMGQPGCSRRLRQTGQLMIGEELLGYHNNNNNWVSQCSVKGSPSKPVETDFTHRMPSCCPVNSVKEEE